MINYGKQFLDRKDILSVANVLNSDWLTQGPTVDSFEDALGDINFANYLTSNANDTTSGTLGIVNDSGMTIGTDSDLSVTVDNLDATNATIAVGDIIQFYTNNAVTAVVNGAITVPTKNLTVDGNSGTAAVGQRVVGAGVSDGGVVVKIATVTSQTALILDKAITVADNVALSFTSDSPIETGNVEYEVTAISSETLTIRVLDDPAGGGIQTVIADNSYIQRRWRFSDLFDSAPGTSAWATKNGRGEEDELHVCVYDKTGDITGYDVDVKGQRTSSVIEVWPAMS